MKKPSYLFLADGFEEIEALSVVDVLRRAEVEIATVSITESTEVTGAHGIKVTADTTIGEIDPAEAEWLILPGGMPGSTNLHECAPLSEALKAHNAKGGKIAAICAAPAVVLAPLGILDGRKATCYPGMQDTSRPINWQHDARVVVCDNVVTGNGPASALKFAIAVLSEATEPSTAQQVGGGMLYYPKPDNLYL